MEKNHENILAFGRDRDQLTNLIPLLKQSGQSVHFEYSNEFENCLSKLSIDSTYRCVIIDRSVMLSHEEEEKIKSVSNELNIPLIYLDGKPDVQRLQEI